MKIETACLPPVETEFDARSSAAPAPLPAANRVPAARPPLISDSAAGSLFRRDLESGAIKYFAVSRLAIRRFLVSEGGPGSLLRSPGELPAINVGPFFGPLTIRADIFWDLRWQ